MTENDGKFDKGLEQARDYLTTMSSAGITMKCRRQAEVYVVLGGVFFRRQKKGFLVVPPIEARGSSCWPALIWPGTGTKEQRSSSSANDSGGRERVGTLQFFVGLAKIARKRL